MANLIQIKRSLTTATPTSLANGEMAFTANGDHLFIGSNGVVVPIGGKQTPGTLTANQALVANSSSAIDKIIVANAVVTTVTANGTVGTSGQVLTSNGTTSYWAVPVTSIGGLSDVAITSVANNNLLVYDLAAGKWENHTISGTTNEVEVTFSTNDVVIGLPDAVTVTTSIGTSGTGAGAGGFLANSTVSYVGNSTVNTAVTNAGVTINGTTFVANTTGVYHTGTVNAASHTAGATGTGTGGTIANTTTFFVGNNTVNTAVTNGGLAINGTTVVANTTGVFSPVHATAALGVANTFYANATLITSGNSTVNTAMTPLSFTLNGTTLIANSTGYFGPVHATGALGTANGFYANATTVVVGNSSVNTVHGVASITINGTTLVANTTGLYHTGTVNAASHTAGATGTGTGGTIANTTTFFVGNNTVNSVMTSGGLTINGTAVVANGTGVWTTGTVNGAIISQGTNFIANSTQVTAAVPAKLNANVALGDASADIISINGQVNTDIIPSTTNTYSLGSTTNRWTGVWANQVTATTGTFVGSISVGGDIVVTGNLITQNVSSVVISDPLIYLAGNNVVSDVVDIGFVAHYNPGSANLHTGLFRDASDGVYKLFTGLAQELEGINTVNTADPTFTIATLNAYLQSGGLSSNGTAITITANSTLSVGITANTLSLTTALPATSGGTGQNTYSVGDLLVGAAGNSLAKLSLGTDGYVLQSNGTAVVYGTLDGGTF